jgi:hypothetical protein
MIGFVRFITFDDDPNILQQVFDSEGECFFKGHLEMQSLEGELLVWAVINAYAS